jgi:hypothetical protein
MVGLLVLAVVFVGGFVWRYWPWLRPARRRPSVEDSSERFRLGRPRDAITVAFLLAGTAVGIVLVAGALLFRVVH